MNKTVKIICVLLAAAVCLPLAGCMVGPAAPGAGSQIEPIQPATPVQITGKVGLSDFDDSLIDFIMKSDLGSGNYMVSPLSLRVAVAMATAGAVGDTQKELLKALGFETADEMNEWAVGINGLAAAFANKAELVRKEQKEYGVSELPEWKFSIANSVWHNITEREPLLDSYIERAARYFAATAANSTKDKIVGEVNRWVNEKTEGLIRELIAPDYDTENVNTILTNTLYLKDAWLTPFEKQATFTDKFSRLSGGETEKEYMTVTDKFSYYEDEKTQLVTLPMGCEVKVTFVLGDLEGIGEKLEKAKNDYVLVKIPKFETETSLDKKELIDFLKAEGVMLAFDEFAADFSEMAVEQVFIGDIIQKTKIKVDEEGLEAAAATAVVMLDESSADYPLNPKEFFANRPFAYFITLSGELLFFGQIAE